MITTHFFVPWLFFYWFHSNTISLVKFPRSTKVTHYTFYYPICAASNKPEWPAVYTTSKGAVGEGHSVGLLFTHFSRVLQCTPVCLYWLLNWNVQKNATLDLHLSSRLTTRKHNAASGKIGQTFLLCACSELKFSVPHPSWECPSPRTAPPGGPPPCWYGGLELGL